MTSPSTSQQEPIRVTSKSDRRNYPRISSEVSVRWAGESVEKPLRDYYERVASNVSLGGLFVEADPPPPVGTLVRLELRLDPTDPDAEAVLATALVRWRQRWSQPRGMGLEFLEFEGLGESDLAKWLDALRETTESA